MQVDPWWSLILWSPDCACGQAMQMGTDVLPPAALVEHCKEQQHDVVAPDLVEHCKEQQHDVVAPDQPCS